MRRIDTIIVHCTATKAMRHFNVNDVRRWHIQRGFNDIGYHYLVLVDGTIQTGRPLSIAGAHCQGHNAHSIGVCYVGGLNSQGAPADTRTPAKNQFPNATIHGHRDFAAKACPCFDATAEYENLSTNN